MLGTAPGQFWAALVGLQGEESERKVIHTSGTQQYLDAGFHKMILDLVDKLGEQVEEVYGAYPDDHRKGGRKRRT